MATAACRSAIVVAHCDRATADDDTQAGQAERYAFGRTAQGWACARAAALVEAVTAAVGALASASALVEAVAGEAAASAAAEAAAGLEGVDYRDAGLPAGRGDA